MEFRPVDSISTMFNTFAENAGYVVLRTLAYMAILVVMTLVLGGIFGAVLIGAGFSTAIGDIADNPTALIAMIGSVGIVALVLAVVALIVGTMLQLGLLRSLMRLVVSGEKRYDLFAPVGKSMQFLTVVVLLGLAYAAVWAILSLVMTASPIIGAILMLVAGLLAFWYVLQLTFIQYRMFGHDESAFTAIAGSYRMLRGSRWAFVLTVLVVVVLLTVLLLVLAFIPIIGWLATMVVNFLSTPLVLMWYAVIHQQLDPAKKVA